MSWRCRELESTEDRTRAAEDALTWGFPRPVESVEIECGFWFRMGKGVVWWFQRPELIEDPGTFLKDQFGYDGHAMIVAGLHLATAPRVRGQWPVRTWWSITMALAEIVDVDALFIATMPEDCKTPDYLSRLGLRQTPSGLWFQRLGDREG